MRQRTKSTVAIALVAVMVLSVLAAPGVATTPSIDTSTTDATSTTSELQSDTTVDGVDGTDDNTSHRLQVNMSPDDTPEMKISRNDSDHVVYRNTSAENVSVAGGGSDAHYNMTVVEEELDDMERTTNANVTADVTAYDADNETGNDTRITVYFNFTDDRNVENIDDADVDAEDIVTTTDESGFLGLTDGTDRSTIEKDDINVTAADEVVFALSNTPVGDDFARPADDTSFVPFRGGTAEDGDFLPAMTLEVTDDDGTTHAIPVFYESAPDGWDDDQTYGVYTEGEIGGEDGVVIHKGDDLDDADEIDVDAVGDASFTDAVGVYGPRTVAFGATSGFSPLAGAGLLGFDLDALTGGLSGLGSLFASGALVGAAAARRREVA